MMKEKWYKKPVYFVTRKNVLSVFLLIFTIYFYILERITESYDHIGNFFFIFFIGQRIGGKVAEKQKKNKPFIVLFVISIIFYIALEIIGWKNIAVFLFALTIGEQVGFSAQKIQMKNK